MKKKVLFFTTALTIGGTEKVMTYYANYLTSANYCVTVVAMFDVGIVDTLNDSISKNACIKFLSSRKVGNAFYKLIQKYNTNRLQKILYILFRTVLNFYYSIKFKKILKSEGVDVVITFDSGLPDYISKIKKAKSIIWCHFSIDHLFGVFFKKYRTKRWIAALKDHGAVIAVSKGIEVQLKKYGFSGSTQIYNPTDPDILTKSQIPVNLPFDYTLNPYMVTVSRLEEGQKDSTTLIKAIAYLKDNYNYRMNLVIVGDGRDRQNLQSLITGLGLNEQIYLVGNQKNPYPYIQNSSLFILSSKFEGLGMVLLEALMLDKLIVSTDCPTGPREILDKDEILVKVGIVKEMAEKIFNLLTNEALNQEVRKHLLCQKKKFLPELSYIKFQELLEN